MVHLLTINMEEAGFITYTVDYHQMAIKSIWLHFRWAVMFPSLYTVGGFLSAHIL